MSYNKYLQEQKVKELVNGILGEEIDCSVYYDEELQNCKITSMKEQLDELINLRRNSTEDERSELNIQIKDLIDQIEMMKRGNEEEIEE